MDHLECLRVRFPDTAWSTERNLLEVERTSEMGRQPERFGITVLGSWPWASVMDWNAPAWRADHLRTFTGHHLHSPEQAA